MSGSVAGGQRAAKTMKLKYGENIYARLGQMGGAASRGHAFAHGKVSPSEAGKIGGKIGGKGRKHPVKDFPLDYEILNDDNAPLFEKTPKLIDRIRKYVRSK